MRSLALLLLLLNITFFTWQQSQLPWLPWQPEQFQPTLQVTPPIQANLPMLQLVGESIPKNLTDESPKDESSKAVAKKTDVVNATQPEITKTVKTEKDEAVQDTKVMMSNSQQTSVALKTETPIEKIEPPIENQIIQKDEEKTAVEETQKKLASVVMTCIEIGPYLQQSTAETSAKWFQKKQPEIKANVEHREVPVITQTKVYLADFKDGQEARLVQQRLIQQGITDHAIFTTKSKSAISLGVYSNEDNAKKRVNQLKEKGYTNVKLEKQHKNDTKYWLNVKIPDNRKDVLDAFKKAFKSVPTLKKITCQ